MERLRITSESLFKWTVFLFAVPTVLFSLAAYFLVFLLFGIGWAYAGTAGCSPVLNPLGMVMATGAVLGVVALLFTAGKRIVNNRKTRRTRGDA
jgi:membrane protein implicated in regulation of membrane protease activity